MAREVTHEPTGPLRIDEAEIDEHGGSVLLCRCGLSAQYPFCDGTHEATRDEAARTLYRYDGDGDGDRREISAVVAVDGDEDGDREVVPVLADAVDDAEDVDDAEETDDVDPAGGEEPERTDEPG